MKSALAHFVLLAAVVALCGAKPVTADSRAENLAARIATAAPGSTLHIAPGLYRGPLVIGKPLTLVAEPGAIIDGGGKGTVVLIKASHVTFQGFTVRGSGSSLDEEDTGIKILGSNEKVLDNTLEDVLFGIYLKASDHSVVAGNHIIGKPLALPIRGDGIRLWYCMHTRIQDNTVRQARDIILWFSKDCSIENNHFQDSRYGLHLMYDRDITIRENTLTHDFVGAFLMYSWNVRFERNTSLANRGVSGYGIGLKNINNLLAQDNRFLDNNVGIFMSSSPSSLEATNVIRRNIIAFDDIGLSLDPSNEGKNIFTLNSFLENTEQVANPGDGELQADLFALNGRGNFWSDYTGYPSGNADIGALSYQVRSLFDNLTNQYDTLNLFRYSPAEQAIDLAAAAFPLVQPHEVITDPDPLISPVPVDAPPLSKPPTGGLLGASAALLGFAGCLSMLLRIPQWHPDLNKTSEQKTSSDHPLVEIHSLRKTFGHTEVLRGITMSLASGEAVALWGDNGAGKSTTIKCIVGLLDYAGDVSVAGTDVKTNGKRTRRLIGYVPQELHFYNDWAVKRTMMFYARLKFAARDEITTVLGEVGLEAHAEKPVNALSGGMKQRLALAIALLGRPRVLLLDEFTASLDVEARTALLDVLKQQRQKGMTVIFTTHRVDEVAALADRVEVLHRGEIIASVSVSEFLQHTAPAAGRETDGHGCRTRNEEKIEATALN